MKKVIFTFIAAVCGVFAVSNLDRGSLSTNAQISDKKSGAQVVFNEKDREMAAELKRLTNRETTFLSQKPTANGVALDLGGGFQSVALLRAEPDGDSSSFCATSLAEANQFFGRDLETGESLQRLERPKRNTERLAEDHGMSEAEFVFYLNLIEEARQNRMMSPNAATINIVNGDGAGEGFNDATAAFANPEGGNTGATRGAQRLNVFNFAADIWEAFLDTNVPININSQFNPLTCSTGSAVLGSAGAFTGLRDYTGAAIPGTWHHVALANKQAGLDLRPADPDINATFNVTIDSSCFAVGHRWYYGLDNATPANRTNLLVVLLHEMGHGLGFSTFANGSTGALAAGLPDVWNHLMFDSATGKYWSSASMTDGERFTSARSNGALRWDGPNVKIASGYLTGGRDAATGQVQLYAPTTFAAGSSVSHFSTAATPSLLMEPFITSGLPIDGDLTRQLFRDIGWYRDTTADQTADTITGVTPNGGGAVIGQVRTITWVNGGSFNRNVKIELSTDGGATYPTVIAASAANTGSFAWTVPNTPSSTARIRVREADFAAPSGTSSANFTISATPLAGGAIVSGSVLDANGRAIARAAVVLTDGNGVSRTALSNPFGYFVFSDVPVGETYVARVRHKRYQFEQHVINLSDNFTGLVFMAGE